MPLALSLFSGCGGCSLGLIEAGFEIALAVDINGDACRTYETNLRHHNVWNVDLTDIQPNIHLTEYKREITVQIGSQVVSIQRPLGEAGKEELEEPEAEMDE